MGTETEVFELGTQEVLKDRPHLYFQNFATQSFRNDLPNSFITLLVSDLIHLKKRQSLYVLREPKVLLFFRPKE